MQGAAFRYYRTNRDSFLSGLQDLLRIPSISTLPEHKPDIWRATEFLAAELTRIGMPTVRVIKGRHAENPLIFAEWVKWPRRPTLLFYGHYDVESPIPLEQWFSPPFEPSIRGDNLYARGAADNKGGLYMLLKAVEGFLQAEGSLPLNIKFLIEGEEEVFGGHIDRYVPLHAATLKSDAALICDTEMFAPGLPTITTGQRGLVYLELQARGPSRDLHSGLFGGVAPNPLQALAHIIAGMKQANGRISIQGFYDAARRPSRDELLAWKRLPFNQTSFFRKQMGLPPPVDTRRISVLERLWGKPTLEVHGIGGGFTAPGAKAVIPSIATAKFSMRLVPDMDPDEIASLFLRSANDLAPKGVEITHRILAKSSPTVVSPNVPYVKNAAAAMQYVFKKKPAYVRSGASVPIAAMFQKYLNIPSVMMGFRLPDDGLHQPNEKIHLPNFYRGIETIGKYLELLGNQFKN